MATEVGSVSGPSQEVAGDDRPVCNLNHRCSLYFSPFHNVRALGMDALLQHWEGLQVYAFPP